MELPKSLIVKLRKQLPELCSVGDLMKIGIYRSDQAAYAARKSGRCPAYFRMPSRGIVYPREHVIDFLKREADRSNWSESMIQDASISHSDGPNLRQNKKGMSR